MNKEQKGRISAYGYHRISKPFHSCAQNMKIPEVRHWDVFVSLSELISTCLYSRLWSQSPYGILGPTERSFPRPALLQREPCYPLTPEWFSAPNPFLIQVSGEKHLIHVIHPNIQMINGHLSLQSLFAFLDTLITDPWTDGFGAREEMCLQDTLAGSPTLTTKYLGPLLSSSFLPPWLSIMSSQLLVVSHLDL